ncbi:hypothetical protein CQA18_27400, partial [Enterobacter hormaechei]
MKRRQSEQLFIFRHFFYPSDVEWLSVGKVVVGLFIRNQIAYIAGRNTSQCLMKRRQSEQLFIFRHFFYPSDVEWLSVGKV